jgi:hypothetical protein
MLQINGLPQVFSLPNGHPETVSSSLAGKPWNIQSLNVNPDGSSGRDIPWEGTLELRWKTSGVSTASPKRWGRFNLSLFLEMDLTFLIFSVFFGSIHST